VQPEKCLEALLREGRGLTDKGVLFPCSDAFVLFVSRYRHELQEHFEFCIPSEKVLEGMVNKRKQYDEAMRIGTPIAKTFYPADMGEVREIRDRLDYPAFIKPYYSHLWYPVFGNKGFKVNGPRELEERYAQIFPTAWRRWCSPSSGPHYQPHQGVRLHIAPGSAGRCSSPARSGRTRPSSGSARSGSFHDDELAALGLSSSRALGIGHRLHRVEAGRPPRRQSNKMIELNPDWGPELPAHLCWHYFPLIMYNDLTGKSVPSPGLPGRGPLDGHLEDLKAFWWYRQRGRTTFSELARSC
jgi:hypothetical protein